MTAIATLAAILENGSDRFRLAAYSRDAIDTLVLAKLIVRDGVVTSVPCDCCDSCDTGSVFWNEHENAYGYRCPEAGFIPCPDESVAAGQIAPDRLIGALGTALGVTRPERLRPGRTVHPLGRFKLGALSAFGFLAPGPLTGDLASAIRAEIDRRAYAEFGAVFVTSFTQPAPLDLPAGHHVLPLDQHAILNTDGGLTIDWAALRALAGPPTAPVRPGRPSGIGSTWTVIEHLILTGQNVPSGLNALSRAIREAYRDVFPGIAVPAPSTIRGHLKELKPRIEERLSSGSPDDNSCTA